MSIEALDDVSKRRRGMRARRVTLLVLAASLFLPITGSAQHPGGHGTTVTQPATVNLHGVVLGTLLAPGITSTRQAEAYLAHPVLGVMASVPSGSFSFIGEINLEGVTLSQGELTPGIYGEGYIDRRHPHTFFHEAVAVGAFPLGPIHASITLGKGFAPFGSDDPMVRPIHKYPVNHHLAQILERAVGIAAIRYEQLTVEAGVFNGDEPANPWDHPQIRRVGDSWAARATLTLMQALELQLSYAKVDSPEWDIAVSTLNRKHHASARWESVDASGLWTYALVEWARTNIGSPDSEWYHYSSALLETGVRENDWQAALRFESTARPEEERVSMFRTVRPPTGLRLFGLNRWDTWTMNIRRTTAIWKSVRVAPFVEVARSGVRSAIGAAVLSPENVYGRNSFWMASVGFSYDVGQGHSRMGRYGVAAAGHH